MYIFGKKAAKDIGHGVSSLSRRKIVDKWRFYIYLSVGSIEG